MSLTCHLKTFRIENKSSFSAGVLNHFKRDAVALAQMGLPVVKIRGIDRINLEGSSDSLSAFLSENRPFLLLAKPLKRNLKGEGQFDVRTVRDVELFFARLNDASNYDISLVQQVNGIIGGYVGVAVRGDLETQMEFLVEDGITDVRRLTSDGADPSKLLNARFLGRVYAGGSSGDKLTDFCRIRTLIEGFPGYYEFVKGEVASSRGIWFTDYHPDEAFANLLRK